MYKVVTLDWSLLEWNNNLAAHILTTPSSVGYYGLKCSRIFVVY